MEVSQFLFDPVQRKIKYAVPVKKVTLLEICRRKPQPNSDQLKKQKGYWDEENNSSEQPSPGVEMKNFHTKDQKLSISLTLE